MLSMDEIRGLTGVTPQVGPTYKGSIYENRNNLTVAQPKQNYMDNLLSSIGGAVSSVGKGVVGSVGEMLGQNSLAKIPQILSSIGRTGWELGPIKIEGSNERKNRDIMSKLRLAEQDFKSGKLNAKQYKDAIASVKAGLDSTSKESQKSADALKDASQYGRQFMNNVALLSLGGTALEGIAGKTALNAAGEQAVKGAYNTGAKGLLKGIGAEIGLPGMVERQAIQGASPLSTALKIGLRGAGNLMDTQSVAGVANDVAHGKVSPVDIGLAASSALPGGPLGALTAGGKKIGSGINKAIYDTSGLFDHINIKGGSVNSLLQKVAEKDPEKASQLTNVLRIAQDNILKQYKGDKVGAAQAIGDYIGVGKRSSTLSLSDFAKELDALAQGNILAQGKKIQKLGEAGQLVMDGKVLTPGELKNLGAVKSTMAEKQSLISALKGAKNSEEAAKVISDFTSQNTRFAGNAQNRGVLDGILNTGMYGDNAAKFVKDNLTGTSQVFRKTADGKLRKVVFDNGYYLGMRSSKAIPFATDVAKVAQLETGHKAPLGFVGNMLSKMGMSTQEQAQGVGGRMFKQAQNKLESLINDRQINIGQDRNVQDMVDELSHFAETKNGITDLRQIKWKEVGQILGVSNNDAKSITKAIKESFLGLPVAERGLANKIMDFNMAKNPLAPSYSRVQSTARYEKNPFFRAQEDIETKLGIASLTKSGAVPGRDYTDTINTLKEAKIFNQGFSNQGAQEGFGKISAKLSRSQYNDLAAGFESLAKQRGVSVAELATNPKFADVVDTIKGIVQYPDKGMTSSNFMKMANLLVFPTRYNIKVTQLAAKALANESGVRQFAVLKGISDMNNYLKSDAGIKWQSKNSEALGLLRYFTPIGSIESVYKMLSGDIRTPRDIGLIGGLPFGVISQALQGQGLINFDSPYLDPKTGEVVPDKIPADMKARLSQLLSDIIGTLYTYPGRIVNAPSKNEATNMALKTLTMGQLPAGKFNSVTRSDLTAEQRNIQRVLSAGGGGKSINANNITTVGKITNPALKPVSITPIYKAKTTRAKRGKTIARSPH